MINYTTPLIQIDRPLDADLVRKAIVANALSIENITGSDETRDILIKLLGPVNGTWDLRRISTCALVARGLWARLKVDYSPLYNNYIFGTAISAEINWAMKLKPRSAWQKPILYAEMVPNPGDYIVIGSGLMTHVLTMIGWDGDNILSIDGGQVDKKGYQCVKKRSRPWTERNGVPYIGTRKVLGWIPIDMLPFKEEKIIVPKGWKNVKI
jgi:hypothetical protein